MFGYWKELTKLHLPDKYRALNTFQPGCYPQRYYLLSTVSSYLWYSQFANRYKRFKKSKWERERGNREERKYEGRESGERWRGNTALISFFSRFTRFCFYSSSVGNRWLSGKGLIDGNASHRRSSALRSTTLFSLDPIVHHPRSLPRAFPFTVDSSPCDRFKFHSHLRSCFFRVCLKNCKVKCIQVKSLSHLISHLYTCTYVTHR